MFRVFPQLVLIQWLHLSPAWQFALFGLGAINFSKHPEGLLENAEQKSVLRYDRMIKKFQSRRAAEVAS